MNIGILLVIIAVVSAGISWFFWERAVKKAREEGFDAGFGQGKEYIKTTEAYKLGYGYQDGYNIGYHAGLHDGYANGKRDGWGDGYDAGFQDGEGPLQ